MASTETQVPEAERVVVPPPEAPAAEYKKVEPPPEVKTPAASPSTGYFALADVVLRFLLFASALVAVVVMVTSKQTEKIPILPFPPYVVAPVTAKFNHSPAFIYFVAALSVAGLYGIITTLLSFFALLKPGGCPTVLSHFVIFDVLLLGIVAAAIGAAGGVAYIGLKGNSHVGWKKACNVYDEFCIHIGASLAVSLVGSIVLVLLVLLSVYSLSKKIPKSRVAT